VRALSRRAFISHPAVVCGSKKERRADPAAERQYDAVIQQARRRVSGRSAMLLPTAERSLSGSALVALICALTAASRDIIRDTKAAIAPEERGRNGIEKNLR